MNLVSTCACTCRLIFARCGARSSRAWRPEAWRHLPPSQANGRRLGLVCAPGFDLEWSPCSQITGEYADPTSLVRLWLGRGARRRPPSRSLANLEEVCQDHWRTWRTEHHFDMS